MSMLRPAGRFVFVGTLVVGAVAALSACGSTPSAPGAAACSSNPDHVTVVVQSSSSHTVQRCVGFSGAGINALAALRSSGIEMGTQTYSFGTSICQLDNVPAHYSTCLPSNAPYWALFDAQPGKTKWASPIVGVSDVTLTNGAALGFRYDPQTGTAAPPSVAP
ncbi:MAG: hypothetical protein ACRDYC_11475 [Acidimicrobiales bacterium]